MEYVLVITIAIVAFSLVFDFINGFHDTANAIATAVSTRALTPRTAILLAAIMNFIGALTFTGVAGTITKDIVDPFKLQNGLVVVLAVLSLLLFEFGYLVIWYTKFFISCLNRRYCWSIAAGLQYYITKVLLRLSLY